MPTQKRKVGDYGEALAVKYLQNKGYIIRDTNWHCQHGELDIVAQHNGLLIFVEVKTRRSDQISTALMGITPSKREKLITAVYTYLDEHELDEATWRIDAIGIAIRKGQPPLTQHVEDALDW